LRGDPTLVFKVLVVMGGPSFIVLLEALHIILKYMRTLDRFI
jgi:hypothetical protein